MKKNIFILSITFLFFCQPVFGMRRQKTREELAMEFSTQFAPPPPEKRPPQIPERRFRPQIRPRAFTEGVVSPEGPRRIAPPVPARRVQPPVIKKIEMEGEVREPQRIKNLKSKVREIYDNFLLYEVGWKRFEDEILASNPDIEDHIDKYLETGMEDYFELARLKTGRILRSKGYRTFADPDVPTDSWRRGKEGDIILVEGRVKLKEKLLKLIKEKMEESRRLGEVSIPGGYIDQVLVIENINPLNIQSGETVECRNLEKILGLDQWGVTKRIILKRVAPKSLILRLFLLQQTKLKCGHFALIAMQTMLMCKDVRVACRILSDGRFANDLVNYTSNVIKKYRSTVRRGEDPYVSRLKQLISGNIGTQKALLAGQNEQQKIKVRRSPQYKSIEAEIIKNRRELVRVGEYSGEFLDSGEMNLLNDNGRMSEKIYGSNGLYGSIFEDDDRYFTDLHGYLTGSVKHGIDGTNPIGRFKRTGRSEGFAEVKSFHWIAKLVEKIHRGIEGEIGMVKFDSLWLPVVEDGKVTTNEKITKHDTDFLKLFYPKRPIIMD